MRNGFYENVSGFQLKLQFKRRRHSYILSLLETRWRGADFCNCERGDHGHSHYRIHCEAGILYRQHVWWIAFELIVMTCQCCSSWRFNEACECAATTQNVARETCAIFDNSLLIALFYNMTSFKGLRGENPSLSTLHLDFPNLESRRCVIEGYP